LFPLCSDPPGLYLKERLLQEISVTVAVPHLVHPKQTRLALTGPFFSRNILHVSRNTCLCPEPDITRALLLGLLMTWPSPQNFLLIHLGRSYPHQPALFSPLGNLTPLKSCFPPLGHLAVDLKHYQCPLYHDAEVSPVPARRSFTTYLRLLLTRPFLKTNFPYSF